MHLISAVPDITPGKQAFMTSKCDVRPSPKGCCPNDLHGHAAQLTEHIHLLTTLSHLVQIHQQIIHSLQACCMAVLHSS